MKQILNEEILHIESQVLTITTHRVRYDNKIKRSRELKSIMLEEISSVRMQSREPFYLLILGAIGIIIGIINAFDTSPAPRATGAALIVLGILFILAYLLLRRHYLIIGSSSTSIRMVVWRKNSGHMEDLINTIEQAKSNRYAQA